MSFKLAQDVETCCPGTTAATKSKDFNPHAKGVGKSKGNGYLPLFEINNPIPDEIRDSELTRKFFDRFRFIPYSGFDKYTSQCIVDMMMNFKYKSVAKSSVTSSINTYSFGGKIDLVNQVDIEFNIGQDEELLQGAEQKVYYDYLKQIDLGGDSYKNLAKKLSDTESYTGNKWLELIFQEIDGVRFFTMKYVNPSYVCYKFSEPGEPRHVGFSPSWEFDYASKFKPVEIGVYPNTTKMADGSFRTILHEKEGHFNWYGRPKDFSTFVAQYNDYKIYEYLTKAVNSMFIANMVMEVSSSGETHHLVNNELAQKTGYKSAAEKIMDKFTVAGHAPMSAIIMQRGPNDTPFKMDTIKLMTKEGFIKEMKAMITNDIVMANDWSTAIMQMDKSSGFNSEIFSSIFDILSCTTVLEKQTCVGGMINQGLKLGAEYLGNEVAYNSAIKFTSPAQKLIEQKAMQEEIEEGNELD